MERLIRLVEGAVVVPPILLEVIDPDSLLPDVPVPRSPDDSGWGSVAASVEASQIPVAAVAPSYQVVVVAPSYQVAAEAWFRGESDSVAEGASPHRDEAVPLFPVGSAHLPWVEAEACPSSVGAAWSCLPWAMAECLPWDHQVECRGEPWLPAWSDECRVVDRCWPLLFRVACQAEAAHRPCRWVVPRGSAEALAS